MTIHTMVVKKFLFSEESGKLCIIGYWRKHFRKENTMMGVTLMLQSLYFTNLKKRVFSFFYNRNKIYRQIFLTSTKSWVSKSSTSKYSIQNWLSFVLSFYIVWVLYCFYIVLYWLSFILFFSSILLYKRLHES